MLSVHKCGLALLIVLLASCQQTSDESEFCRVLRSNAPQRPVRIDVATLYVLGAPPHGAFVVDRECPGISVGLMHNFNLPPDASVNEGKLGEFWSDFLVKPRTGSGIFMVQAEVEIRIQDGAPWASLSQIYRYRELPWSGGEKLRIILKDSQPNP